MLFFILRNSVVIDSQQHFKLSQGSLHWYFSRQSEISVHPCGPDQSTRNGFHYFLLCKKPLSSHSTSSPFLQYSLLFFSETVKRNNHTYLSYSLRFPIYANVFPYFYSSFILVSTVQYITAILLAKILFFYVIHLYPVSILYRFTFTALSDISYFLHCPGIFVFIIM